MHPLDDGRAVGALLARSRTADVVDAHLVTVAVGLGDDILTADLDDLMHLVAVLPAGRRPKVIAWP